MTLCLFRHTTTTTTKTKLMTEIILDPKLNKTGDVWHTQVRDLSQLDSLYYGWKADGDHGWEGGSRFHPNQVLLDPLSHHVSLLTLPGSSSGVFLGCLSELNAPVFNWENVINPRHGFEDFRVAEMDLEALVKDLTIIKRLSEAGVNGVVLKGVLLASPEAASSDPVSFFAANQPIFGGLAPKECSQKLKEIIKELHWSSIEALMEVQYCFTSETKNILSLKGIDVSLYFRGKGILNCGHPVVQDFILNSLRFWKHEYKFDGFVFVNSETMTQDRDGVIQDCPALPEAIASDPVLRWCKLVAISGNDNLIPRQGERGFPHWGVWTEYNTRFQFDFWDFMVTNISGKLSNIATRIAGSADLFASCWDGGFPGNLAAGRRPAFGFNSPLSFGKSLVKSLENRTPQILSRKSKEASSLQTSLACALLIASCVSRGVPIFPQDCFFDPLLTPFVKKLLAFRVKHSTLIQPDSFDAVRLISWHGIIAGNQPDWDDIIDSSFIGYSCRDETGNGFYAAFNASPSEVSVQAPDLPVDCSWRCLAYTASPNEDNNILVAGYSMFKMEPQTAVVMEIVNVSDSAKQMVIED
eukprot:g1584.t1